MVAERFPVEAGHILMFARAIADPNPIYRDADYAASSEVGAILAPPTFTWASSQFDEDNPLRWSPDRPWNGSGREATGTPRGAAPTPHGDGGEKRERGVFMHAEQHYEYHRPVVAGDVLTVTERHGERWEKEGRAGTLRFSETINEYRDRAGELVVTVRMVFVETPRPKRAEKQEQA